MRYRVRIQPYISPELYRKLRAHSAVRNVTDSAVAEEALSKYLESDAVEEALMLRPTVPGWMRQSPLRKLVTRAETG
jgi:hypothetical protein